MPLKGQVRSTKLPARYTVMGAARSGLAVARYLYEHGYSVLISDNCSATKLDFILASNDLAQIPHEAGEHSDKVLDCDVIILSPGIPSTLPILETARRKGIPVWSEIEFAFRCSLAQYCAVTGSTGKSTTVSMIGGVMEAGEKHTVVAGNIGVPLTAVAPKVPANGVVVAEISSFQLENIDKFKPQVAVVLNLMKNHLDRYATEEDYYAAKKNMAKNMDAGTTLILNAEDKRLFDWGGTLKEKVRIVFFGKKCEGFTSVWEQEGTIVSDASGSIEKILHTDDMKLAGSHNISNACAAVAAGLAFSVSPEHIASGICSFAGLPHRLEFAGTHNKVDFYNDSKSTTAESMAAAISSFKDNVIVIAGGRDKGCDFDMVQEVVTKYVKHAVLIGEAAGRIAASWKGCTNIVKAEDFDEAVKSAFSLSEAGDVVVLSPGCSSFDMFANYEERGEEFKRLVSEL